MIIEFDLEASDQGAAFFALYAGLRMYKDLKSHQTKGTEENSIAGAEAYIMLETLAEKFPKLYKEASAEYSDTVRREFEKIEKYDYLYNEVAKYYEGENNEPPEKEGDLCDIGQQAAVVLGWL